MKQVLGMLLSDLTGTSFIKDLIKKPMNIRFL